MILTRQFGRFTLRQDPVLIAKLVAWKQSRMGQFWPEEPQGKPEEKAS